MQTTLLRGRIKQIKVQNKVFLARKTAMIEENMLG